MNEDALARMTTLAALEEKPPMLTPNPKGELEPMNGIATPLAMNWRSQVKRVVLRPEAAVWLMLTDLLFFADSIPFLWPFLVVPSFIFGAGGVLAIEKLAKGKPDKILVRALLAGGLAALPTPIIGTLSGAVALMARLSGWSRQISRENTR